MVTTAWPLFGLIGLGYGARRWGLLTPAKAEGVHALVYYFALPALLFLKVAAMPPTRWLHWPLVGAYYSASGIVLGVALLLGWVWFRQRLAVRGLLAVAAIYPNVGYLGLPLILTLFGEAGVAPAVLFFVADNVLGLIAATAFIEVDRGQGQQWSCTVRTVCWGLARNPMIGAVGVGAVAAALGVPVPPPVTMLGQLLGAAATPGALVALGAALAAVGQPTTERIGQVVLPVGLKLLAHPVLVWVLVTYVVTVDPLWRTVAILEAVLPTATNVYVVAQQYDIAVDLVSTTILIATGASLVTVSIVVGLLAP